MQNVLTILWGHVFNYEKSIARAVYLNHFMDIALNFEKSINRAEYFHHFMDIALNFKKSIAGTVCLNHLRDISWQLKKNGSLASLEAFNIKFWVVQRKIF